MKRNILSVPIAFVCNIAMVYVIYVICRLAYLFDNWSALSIGFDSLSIGLALKGCWMFDTSAILYTNALYALLMLFPIHIKERGLWQSAAKWLYVAVNTICIVANLSDSVYFKYTGRRTTSSVFSEFSNEHNISGIIGAELLNHWYLVVLGILLIAGLIFFYFKPKGSFVLNNRKTFLKYYLIHFICFAIYILVSICGMRGGATKAVRPITISNANQYVNKPSEAALILNTPFSMIRTVDKNVFKDPHFFSKEDLDAIYSPVHLFTDSTSNKGKNVVVLIIESFGREYIGAYNTNLVDDKYKGYTPFVDSLLQHSVTYEYTFGNGRKSVDGMPSVLSGIPRFIEPFILTPASMNDVSGLAGELGKAGYYSAFFHGAENGSMGFEAFARATGYKDYYGRTEYNNDKRFGGDDDFDGMWAIWDEEFLQFYALKMSEMTQPFITTVFTASSHHPYAVPAKYKGIFQDMPDDNNVMHKCIRYADYSLKRFFETARKQPWYNNTIFILTADHTNISSYPYYQTELGLVSVPIIFFDPSGELSPERRKGIAQHIDIMPTILNYLGYNQPYVAFGTDLFNTPSEQTWLVGHNNGIYFYAKNGYLILITESGEPKAVYNYNDDWYMKNNIIGTTGEIERRMELELKSIIQSYMERMTGNELVVRYHI